MLYSVIIPRIVHPGEYIASPSDVTTEGGAIQPYLLQNKDKTLQAAAVLSECHSKLSVSRE